MSAIITKNNTPVYLCWITILALLMLLVPSASAQDTVQTLTAIRPPSSPMVTQSFIVTAPPIVVTSAAALPPAIVILLPGGDGNIQLTPAGSDGTLDINSNNFLTRSRWLFAGHGFYVITMDAASDFLATTNVLMFQQGNINHINDVMQVIAWARGQLPGVPVWLVGTSRGTAGAFVAAMFGPGPTLGGPDGLVFSSAINESTDPDSLLSAKLAAITVPVLLVNDAGNTCANTLPSGDPGIKSLLTASPVVNIRSVPASILFPLTDSCHALSDHGYFGHEPLAVTTIADWIIAH